MVKSRYTGVRKRVGSQSVVRYAVIGLGHIAQAAVLPAFKHARRNSRLAALVSDHPRKSKELARRYSVPHCCTYRELDALFGSGEIDAAYIALPNNLHAEFAMRAMRSGVHVLCEKPMAVSARECQQMIRAAARAKVKLMVAYRLHFERANIEAAGLARSGKLGELRYFSSDFSMQVRDDNIRIERAKGGGPLYDIGVYCINAARYALSEEPTAVWACATRSDDPRFREVDETVVGVLRFRSERLASFTCSFGAADRSTYTIAGTRGTVTLDPAYEYAEGLKYELRVAGRQRHRTFGKSDQFAPELLYFSDCILQGRQPEPSGEEGLIDVRIIEAMLRSIKTGRWVALRPAIQRRSRPTMRQEQRRPAVPREPKLIDAKPASQ